MKYDLHTHSKYSSDGWMDVKTMIKTSMKCDLSGIAVTDHNTIKGGLEAQKMKYELKIDNFEVIVGSEISTERGEVLGLFLSEEIKSRVYLEVIDEIKDQDGLIVIPHPFDNLRDNGIKPDEKDVNLIDFVEVLNSRCLNKKYNEEALRFTEKYGLKSVAGSDAHFKWELGNAGIEIVDSDLRDALINGKTSIFGNRSLFTNIGLTRMVKTWRKTRYG